MTYVHYDLNDGHAIAFYESEPTFIDSYIAVDIPEEMECYAVDLSTTPPTPLIREIEIPIFDDTEQGKSVDERINALEAENLELRNTIDTILTEVIPSLMEV